MESHRKDIFDRCCYLVNPANDNPVGLPACLRIKTCARHYKIGPCDINSPSSPQDFPWSFFIFYSCFALHGVMNECTGLRVLDCQYFFVELRLIALHKLIVFNLKMKVKVKIEFWNSIHNLFKYSSIAAQSNCRVPQAQ